MSRIGTSHFCFEASPREAAQPLTLVEVLEAAVQINAGAIELSNFLSKAR